MTDERLRTLLADYASGTLGDEEHAEVAAALARSPALAREAVRDRELLHEWARQASPAASPSRAVRRRLLETVSGPGRFAPFLDTLRRTFDLDDGALAGLLRRVDDRAGWNAAPMPGVRYFHFSPGPALGTVECGFVRMAPSARFPRHRHRGPEKAVVLDGHAHDTGRVYGPGSIIEWPAGSAHDYAAGPERDLIVVFMHGGIDFET